MNHRMHFSLVPSAAKSVRHIATVPVPSAAWVKTLAMLSEINSASTLNSRLPTELNAPRRVAAAELMPQRTPSRPASRFGRGQSRQGPHQRDTLLGIVAVGGLLVVLAWVVTGIDLLALVALLIAAASFIVAFTSRT